MNETEIKQLVEKQRSRFCSGATLDINRRIAALKKLKTCIRNYESEIETAIRKDTG